jgi:hypothetical protein
MKVEGTLSIPTRGPRKCGLSPCVRGHLLWLQSKYSTQRSIPACAGALSTVETYWAVIADSPIRLPAVEAAEDVALEVAFDASLCSLQPLTKGRDRAGLFIGPVREAGR